MSIATSSHHLQHRLKIAVLTVGWTYSLFWKMCPLQRVLVWNDGYYNGGIKTVKTVIPMEDTTEEVTLELQRSQRLKELYDMLSAGEGNNQPPEAAKRPPAGDLSPEDLTETEWFYLMCISFSFPPGIGLPGKAFVKRQHEWLITANETNRSVFIRAVLAKSASIRTVVCIPILDGVVELGTTLKVEEDYSFIQTIKALFITNHHQELVMKLALSQNSTSNPTTTSASSSSSTRLNPTDKYQINEVEDEDEDEGEEEEPVLILSGSGPETEADKNDLDEHRHDQEQRAMELTMQLDADDMPEDIRIGPNDGSNTNVEYDNSDLNMFVGAKSTGTLSCPHPTSGLSSMCNKLTEEENFYSQTVSTVLQHKPNMSNSSGINYQIISSPNSVFTKFPTSTSTSTHHRYRNLSSSQSMLKSILFSVPHLHSKDASSSQDEACPKDSTSQFHKAPSEMLQEETSVSHVLAERRRREKLNERFIVLRSLVPFVTNIDKASIIGDTIEYVKQLKKKVQELEASKVSCTKNVTRSNGKRKMEVGVEVSIIENDALVELHCPHREGLLLEVMQILRELEVEVTIVQSSLIHNRLFVAELRAKVKPNAKGKRVSITEVKRSLHQIILRS